MQAGAGDATIPLETCRDESVAKGIPRTLLHRDHLPPSPNVHPALRRLRLKQIIIIADIDSCVPFDQWPISSQWRRRSCRLCLHVKLDDYQKGTGTW